MTAPADLNSYSERSQRNSSITGTGLGVTVHMCCPFCAAADWLAYRVLDVRSAMSKGATCKECGRSARAVFFSPGDGGIGFEIVQTGGPDQPAWLVPKMRRIG